MGYQFKKLRARRPQDVIRKCTEEFYLRHFVIIISQRGKLEIPQNIYTIRKLKRLLTNHRAETQKKGRETRKEATQKVACLKFAIKMSHK